jgi:sigma-B regulation protein RsbU (phosphoserine phosphatase)
MQVLIIDPPEHSVPEGTADALHDIGWAVTAATDYASGLKAACNGPVDAVIMADPPSSTCGDGEVRAFENLMRLIDARQIATVMVTDEPLQPQPSTPSSIDAVPSDVALAELRGRFAMIERYHRHVRRMEEELRNMERLGKRLNEHFREVDQEMQLAARLQRDFLPQVSEPIGNAQFAAVYRPASWVSGDIYDIFRIDEDRTGFYVADAVGHGMAASLLTMFIKRSIVPKEVDGGRYAVVSPSYILTTLNNSLANESLPNCQFVTACYGLFNHRTLSLEYARGGHPYPILITAEGIVSDLKTAGGLLGLFKGSEFPTLETRLNPGDKVLLFTDGVELAFQPGGDDRLDTTAYHKAFESLASLPIQDMVRQIDARLDNETGSLKPHDDITIVGLEILDK